MKIDDIKGFEANLNCKIIFFEVSEWGKRKKGEKKKKIKNTDLGLEPGPFYRGLED